MTNTPISAFFLRMSSFHVHDVAVLFMLVSAQENCDPITKGMENASPYWLDALSTSEYQKSFQRLLKSGEIVKTMDGFRVKRFVELQDFMTDFGRRRYYRLKARERRS